MRLAARRPRRLSTLGGRRLRLGEPPKLHVAVGDADGEPLVWPMRAPVETECERRIRLAQLERDGVPSADRRRRRLIVARRRRHYGATAGTYTRRHREDAHSRVGANSGEQAQATLALIARGAPAQIEDAAARVHEQQPRLGGASARRHFPQLDAIRTPVCLVTDAMAVCGAHCKMLHVAPPPTGQPRERPHIGACIAQQHRRGRIGSAAAAVTADAALDTFARERIQREPSLCGRIIVDGECERR